MGNSTSSEKLAWLWRRIVIFAAKKPALASPFMCTMVVIALVIGLWSTSLWGPALSGSILSLAFKEPEVVAGYIVLAGRILFLTACFMYFSRLLQLCYPKYYERQYDRTH